MSVNNNLSTTATAEETPRVSPFGKRAHAQFASTRNPSVPAEADGSNSGVQLSVTPRSHFPARSFGSTSGTVSFRGVVIQVPTFKTNKGKHGAFTTGSVTIVVTSDVPRPEDVYDENHQRIPLPASMVWGEDRINIIANSRVRRDEEDPHALTVVGVGRSKDDDDNSGGGKAPMQRWDIGALLCQGQYLVIQSAKFDKNDPPAIGDEYEFGSVSYKIEQGQDNTKKGGKDNRHVLYRNWDAGSVVRLSRRNDQPYWAGMNRLASIIYSIAPTRSSNYPALIRNPNVSVAEVEKQIEEEKAKERAKKKSASLATAASNLAKYGVSLAEEPDALLQQQQQQKDGTALDVGDEGPQASTELTEKEKTEVARRVLTPSSLKGLNDALWIVPVHLPDAVHSDYFAMHELRFKFMVPQTTGPDGIEMDAIGPDPSQRQFFCYPAPHEGQQRSNQGPPPIIYTDPRPVPPDQTPMRLCPSFDHRIVCMQQLPKEAMPGEPVDEHGKPLRDGRTTQRYYFDIHNSSHSLKVYGIQHPTSMGLVLPSLISATPALNLCYVTKLLDLVNALPANPAAADLPVIHLSGCVVGVDRDTTGPISTATKHELQSLLPDLGAGLMSAGYPITYEAAIELFRWAANFFGRTMISADGNMGDGDLKNPYAKSSPLEDGPIINLWETRVNYAAEGKTRWAAYVVSNWAQKPSRNPGMQKLLDALKATKPSPMENARKLFGKLFVDIANGRAKFGMSNRELATASPEEIAENERATKAYADSLAKAGGLKALPFEPKEMLDLFGPIHPSGHEAEISQQSMPFHCVVFAVKNQYLAARSMTNYLGQDFFRDVIHKEALGYEKAVSMPAGTETYQDYLAKVRAARAAHEALVKRTVTGKGAKPSPLRAPSSNKDVTMVDTSAKPPAAAAAATKLAGAKKAAAAATKPADAKKPVTVTAVTKPEQPKKAAVTRIESEPKQQYDEEMSDQQQQQDDEEEENDEEMQYDE